MIPQKYDEIVLNTIAISWVPFYATAEKQQYTIGKKLLEEQLTILKLSPMKFMQCFTNCTKEPFRVRRRYIEAYKKEFGIPTNGKTRGEVIVEDVIKLSRNPHLNRTFIRTIMERR